MSSTTCIYAGIGVHNTLHQYIESLMNEFDRFIGFEPNPYEFDKIKDRVSHIPGVEIYNVAVSNTDEDGLDYYISNNDTGSSLYPITHESDIKDKVTVSTIHLGRFLKSINVHSIDLYVSDIQGNDLTALRSMETFLTSKCISTIKTEVHGLVSGAYIGCNDNKLINFLKYKPLVDNYIFKSVSFDGATYINNTDILRRILEDCEYDVTWTPRN